MSAGPRTRWSREELDRARQIARERLKVTPLVSLDHDFSARETTPPVQFGPLFHSAAVRSRFRMEELEGPGSDRAEVERLREVSICLRERAGFGWRTLSPETRNAVLKEMSASAIAAAIEGRADSDDPLQKALRVALQGIRPEDLLKLESGEIAALVQTHEGLSAHVQLPPRTDLERKLELARLLEPLKRITRTFSGREKELQKLREYVGVVPPATLVGKLARALTAPFTPTRKAPFLLYGPGGVGKTTLTAEFILEHALLDSKLQFPFAYLDFDRPTVMATKAATILVEAVRQIGLQYDAAYPASEKFRARWEQALRTTRSTDESLEATIAENFALFLETLEVREGPVLFVLDTFEEVQRRSSVYAGSVIQLVQGLASRVPRLRVVIAGRAEILGIQLADSQTLEQFDKDSAIAYLGAHQVDARAAGDIFEKVGGSPLALTLALQIYRRDPEELRAQSSFKIDSVQLQDEVIQAQLFDRILLHIKDPDVQRLAHPGLVLRRVTPELIRDVLAEPCGITIRDDAHLDELFEELANEGTLVTRPEPRVLVHRPGVRRLMLGPLRHDARQKVDEIHRRAIDFYSTRQGTLARAEEVYHRLSLGQSREEIEPLVTSDMEPFLSNAVDELEPPEQALLVDLLGGRLELSTAARQAADQQTWERAAARRLREWMGTHFFDTEGAESLLAERPQLSAQTDLRLVAATYFDRAGEHYRARSLADESITAYRDAGNREKLFTMLLVAATIDQKDGQYERAHARLTEAEEIARRRDDPLMLAHVLRDRMSLLDAESTEIDDDLRSDLIAAAARVADAEWSADLTLLRSIAEAIGRETPELLERALRLGGLELSTSGFEYMRQVLEEHRIPVKDVRATLHDVLAKSTPPPTLVDALMNVLGIEAARREQRAKPRHEDATAVRLSVAQREKLRDLLARHYGTRLASFVEGRFGFALEGVSFSEDVPTSAMDLIRASEREGWWLNELLVGFAKARFDNAEVRRFLDSLGIGPMLRETATMPEKDLRAIVDEYRGKVGALEARTCTFMRNSAPVHQACGILTAADRVTTLPEGIGEIAPDEPFFRFDIVDMKGRVLNEGRTCGVAKDQPPGDPQSRTLVVRLAERIGDQPLDRLAADRNANPRGFVSITPREYVAGEPLLWLWRDIKSTYITGVRQEEVRYTDDGRLIVNAPSPREAAGAPCFDSSMNVFAIHCGPLEGNDKLSTVLPLS